jgi:intermediate cleaving peptidase 55
MYQFSYFSMSPDNTSARSYPATGTFTPPQKDLYSAVLAAKKTLVALCHESAKLSLHDLHRKSCDLLRTELNQIGFGLHTGDLERVLYPHFLSHPIGIGDYLL